LSPAGYAIVERKTTIAVGVSVATAYGSIYQRAHRNWVYLSRVDAWTIALALGPTGYAIVERKTIIAIGVSVATAYGSVYERAYRNWVYLSRVDAHFAAAALARGIAGYSAEVGSIAPIAVGHAVASAHGVPNV
jgi:hypothetical protein